MPKYLEVPSDEPTPPGAKEVKKPVTGSHGSLAEKSQSFIPSQAEPGLPDETHFPTGPREIVETVGAGAKLLDKYGVGVFLMVVFTIILVASLYYARSDANAKDAATRASHEVVVKSVVDTFTTTVKNLREDHRDDQARRDSHEAKMYDGMKRIETSNHDQTRATQELLQEFRKIANKMP